MLLAAAEVELEDGRHEEAAFSASEAETICREAGDDSLRAASLLAIAAVRLVEGKREEAVRAGRQALQLYRGLADRKGEARCMARLAEVHLANGAIRDAKNAAKDSHAYFRELGMQKDEASQLLALAEAHLAGEEKEKAISTAKEAMAAFEEMGFGKGEAMALKLIVRAHVMEEEAPKAVSFAKEALARFQEREDPLGEVAALDALTDAHLAGDSSSPHHAPQEALVAAKAALDICQELGDKKKEAAMLLSVSEMQILNEEHDEARRGFEEVLELFRELGDKRGMANALLAVSGLRMPGDPEKALEEAKEARRLLERVGDRKKTAQALMYISWIHNDVGQFEKAEGAAGLAREEYKTVQDRSGEANAWITLASIHYETGHMEESLVAAKKAHTLLQNPVGRQERKLLENTLHWMAGVYVQRSEPEEALRLARAGDLLVRQARQSTPAEKARMKLLTADAKRELLWREAFPEDGKDDPDRKAVQKLFAEAFRSAELAVTMARPVGDKQLLGKALHTAAHMYNFCQSTKEALKSAEEAGALLRETGEIDMDVYNSVLIAETLDMDGDSNAALITLEGAINRAQRIGFEKGLAYAADVKDRILQSSGMQGVQVALPSEGVPEQMPQEGSSQGRDPLIEEAVPYLPPDPLLVKNRIKAMVQSMLADEGNVRDDAPLMEAGIDSLSSVELRTQLQQEFMVVLPTTVVLNYPTVAALGRLIVKEMTAQSIEWHGTEIE